jgi:hypothetical protein
MRNGKGGNMAAEKMKAPKQVFARVRNSGTEHEYVEAYEIPDEFDDGGIVGRYELVEEGKITIENSFVPKARGGK